MKTRNSTIADKWRLPSHNSPSGERQ